MDKTEPFPDILYHAHIDECCIQIYNLDNKLQGKITDQEGYWHEFLLDGTTDFSYEEIASQMYQEFLAGISRQMKKEIANGAITLQ